MKLEIILKILKIILEEHIIIMIIQVVITILMIHYSDIVIKQLQMIKLVVIM